MLTGLAQLSFFTPVLPGRRCVFTLFWESGGSSASTPVDPPERKRNTFLIKTGIRKRKEKKREKNTRSGSFCWVKTLHHPIAACSRVGSFTRRRESNHVRINGVQFMQWGCGERITPFQDNWILSGSDRSQQPSGLTTLDTEWTDPTQGRAAIMALRAWFKMRF